MPQVLQRYPNLDSWLRINSDRTITVFTGKVELGQGIKTAVALIAAEKLDVSVDRILVAPTDSSYSPEEGLTVSSVPLETTGKALRWAAAEARKIMISVAYEELEVPLDRLEISDGTIKDPASSRSTDYWQIFGGKTFGKLVTGYSQPKSAQQYTILGDRNARIDAAGKDPVEFRLEHLQDQRAKAVIRAAAEKAGWGPNMPNRTDGRGRGIAFAQYKNRQCYAALAVELEVVRENGHIQLERVIIAADAGHIVSTDGLSNQLEGGFTQAASWTINEQVKFDQQGITSRDWDTYPILYFPQAPKIETWLINRPGTPFLGAGEAAHGPTPAAIANAIYAAVGIRLREIPFKPEVDIAALLTN